MPHPAVVEEVPKPSEDKAPENDEEEDDEEFECEAIVALGVSQSIWLQIGWIFMGFLPSFFLALVLVAPGSKREEILALYGYYGRSTGSSIADAVWSYSSAHSSCLEKRTPVYEICIQNRDVQI